MVLNVDFMTLNILELDFLIFLEFVIKLRASLQKFVGKYWCYAILSDLKQILNNYLFIITFKIAYC